MKNYYSIDVEYDVLVTKIHRWIELISFGGQFSKDEVLDSVKSTLDLIHSERDLLISKVFGKKKNLDASSYVVQIVDIFILSLVIGLDLGLNTEDITILGISAMFKDLGMDRIPPEILNKKEDLTVEEFIEIKNHPLYSAEVVKELGCSEDIQSTIIDHHERWDGKGYPKGKRGDDINYLSRIISVLDGYSAMREDRPYRESITGYDAVKSIIGDNGQRYDPKILTVVVRSIGIYPVGSYVALNDTSICQVLSANKKAPLKPIVKIIVNKDGTESKSNSIIDISDNNRFFIVKSVFTI
ncbi:MAG: hypothetical protein B6229_00950 [Spirochaetaceae bacterium 4572_7]|nr:MAG: hypothetical protein B6229_00950 [Spirochaetaceae bacterium 4572_7]